MSEISQELAQRMAAHLRECAEVSNIRPNSPETQRRFDEMKAIVAELPEPVDPLLIEAREIVKVISQSERGIHRYAMDNIDAGEWDNLAIVRSTLAGLKRGHALGVIEAAARGQA